MGSQDTNQDAKVGTMAWIEKSVSSERGALPPRNDISAFKDHLIDTVSGNTVKSATELWGDDPSLQMSTNADKEDGSLDPEGTISTNKSVQSKCNVPYFRNLVGVTIVN